MRYCGLRIFPIRRSRIRTATVCSLLDSWKLSVPAPAVGLAGPVCSVDWRRARVEGAGHAPDTSRPLCQTRDRAARRPRLYQVRGVHHAAEMAVEADRRDRCDLVRGDVALVERVRGVEGEHHVVPEVAGHPGG